MEDAHAIWAAKSDDELLEASSQLFDFTEAGERIVRAELQRRGLPLPDPPIDQCRRCLRSIAPNHPGDRCSECEEPFPPQVLARLGANNRLEANNPEPTLVLAFETADPGLVPLAKSMLDEERIEYLVRGVKDPFAGGYVGGGGYGNGSVEFWVREEDAQRAQPLLDGLSALPAEPGTESDRDGE